MRADHVRPIHVGQHSVTFTGDLPSPLQNCRCEVAEVEEVPADDVCVVTIPGDGALFYLWGRRADLLSVASAIGRDLEELGALPEFPRHKATPGVEVDS